jgi:hypothetical protein
VRSEWVTVVGLAPPRWLPGWLDNGHQLWRLLAVRSGWVAAMRWCGHIPSWAAGWLVVAVNSWQLLAVSSESVSVMRPTVVGCLAGW